MNSPPADTLFQCLPLPCWVLDAQTRRVLAVNAAAAATFGYAQAEFVQKRLEELLAAEADGGSPSSAPYPAPPSALADAAGPSATPAPTVWRLRHRSGVVGTFELESAPLVFEGRSAWLQVARDLGRERRTEEALRHLERRYRDIIETATEGVWIIDAEARTTFVNDTMAKMMGYASADMIGRPLMDFMDERGAAIAEDNLERRRRGVAEQHEFCFQRCDRSALWVHMATHPMHDDAGRYAGALAMVTDISERRRLDQELRLLAASVARLGEIVLITEAEPLDGSGPRIVFVNEAFERRTGYTRDEVLGRTPRLLQGPGTDRVALDRIKAALQRWEPVRAELLNYTKAGQAFWLEIDIVPVADERGRYTHWVSVQHDITERKRADDKLRESEARFRRLIENIMDGVLLARPDGTILAANQAACRILGRTLEQLQAGGRRAVADPADPRLQQLLDQRKAAGHVSGALTLVRGDGLRFEAEVTSNLYDGPDGTQLSSLVIRDISARVRDEARLRRTNRTLRVLSSANLALFKAESEAALLSEVCRVLVDVGGYRMSWVGYAEDDPAKSVRPVAQSGDDTGYLQHSRFSWDGGSEFGRGPTGLAIATAVVQINQDSQQNVALQPWRAAAQQRGYRSSIALPLVDAGRAFGALTAYAAQVKVFDEDEVAALEELARNLSFGIGAFRTRSQRDAAQGANQAKSEFLANMSHEIRTPLNAIMGLNYLLRREGVTPAQEARLDKIKSAGEHLLSIINDVLDLSKIEAGRVQIETTNFHLSAVLDGVHSIIAEAARAKGLVVSVDGNAVPLWLRGDPTRLRQALLNFASNALKFTETGSIRLAAKLLRDHGDELLVRFSVTDTGIGLAAEQMPRLFQPFEQADPTITRKYGGTGLGLAITRRLAELMQGECGVESQEGVGSTFWFTAALYRGHGILPAAKADSPATVEELLRGRHCGARILLAEDNEVNREVAMAMLHGVGLGVDVAADGREAVTMASAARYDLVLMDMQMPVMGGLEATRAIRLLDGWTSRPIVALTANAFDEDRAACKAAGMNDFISKPMNVDALYSTLLKWLDVATDSHSRA